MTMRRNNAGYFIRQGLRGLSSHRFFTFAAIGIIAACLIVTGSVALVAVNLEYNLNQLMAENEILAYVEENYSEEETEKVGETLRDVPNVTDCTFVSREDALDSYLDGWRTTRCILTCRPPCCGTGISSTWRILRFWPAPLNRWRQWRAWPRSRRL